MTPKEFFYLVSQMRSAQKEYFKSRAPQVLRAARHYEDAVDLEIRRVNEVLTNYYKDNEAIERNKAEGLSPQAG